MISNIFQFIKPFDLIEKQHVIHRIHDSSLLVLRDSHVGDIASVCVVDKKFNSQARQRVQNTFFVSLNHLTDNLLDEFTRSKKIIFSIEHNSYQDFNRSINFLKKYLYDVYQSGFSKWDFDSPCFGCHFVGAYFERPIYFFNILPH